MKSRIPDWAWLTKLRSRWTPLRIWQKIVILLIVGFLLIQAVPIDRSNPPVTSDIPTSAEVKNILKTSCYDCHSNETDWPWYGYVAPLSWWMKSHIKSGRNHVNFSTWDEYSPEEQANLVNESWDKIDGGGMPPGYYELTHSDAKISDEEKEILREWANQ